MFDNLLLLLEGQPVAAQIPITGGGPLLERRQYPRPKPYLELSFKFGFLVTGQLTEKQAIQKPVPLQPKLLQPMTFTLHGIRGQLVRTVNLRFQASGRLYATKNFQLPVLNRTVTTMQLRLAVVGETVKNVDDLERDIADLRYLVSKKKRRGKI